MKNILAFLILVLVQPELSACDCISPPMTFITSISEYTAVFEVVQIDTLSIEDRNWPLVLTKLKVVKSFNANVDVTHVWMNNASSPDCERGLSPDHIGQEYVITGEFVEGKRFDKWIDDSADRTFMYVSSCGEMLLDIEGSTVVGVISKSNQKKISEKYNRLKLEDESKAVAYYEEIYNSKHHPELVQTMPLNEFYSLMKR